MCGITGIYNFGNNRPVEREKLTQMCNIIRHRGPDSEGIFLNDNIGLGIRRLAIIDLQTGDQPIHNEDKTLWLVLNGEIYNFLELRQQLEKKHNFYTKTDTEVIIHLYEDYGENCVQYLRGMFAFAIWDEKKVFCINTCQVIILLCFYVTLVEKVYFHMYKCLWVHVA